MKLIQEQSMADFSFSTYNKNNTSHISEVDSVVRKLRDDISNVDLALEYINTLISKNRSKEAKDILLYYIQLFPNDQRFRSICAKMMVLNAVKCKASSLSEKSAGYLEAANMAYPDSSSILTELGHSYLELNNPRKALKYLIKAQKLDTENTDIKRSIEKAQHQIQPGDSSTSKQDHLPGNPYHVCLAIDMFGHKKGTFNGPAFSKIDTLTSILRCFPNSVSVLTAFTPNLPESMADYASNIKNMTGGNFIFPEWIIEKSNHDNSKKIDFNSYFPDHKPDLIIVDGVRLFSHRFLKHAEVDHNIPKVFIHRGSPDQYTGMYTNEEEFDEALEAMKQYDYHVSVSRNVMQEWLRYPELSEKKWFYIPNCAREEEAATLLERDSKQLRSSLGLPEKAFIVVCVASIQKRKGQDIIISLMPELNHKIPDLEVILVGPVKFGWGGRSIFHLAKSSPHAKNVRFFGLRNDALELIRCADCLVLPSREEALPRAVLEAMTLKTPIVASNINGIPELIDHEVSGLLFSHDKPRDMAKHIAKFARDKDCRTELAQNAYDRYWEKFSRVKHAQRWQRSLSEMLNF